MKKTQLLTVLFASSLLSLSACTTTDVISSTSSTLDAATPDVTLNNFVNVRIATLKKEAAVGEGENIDALASLMGKEDKKAFSELLHKNYSKLFTQLEQPSALIVRIQKVENQT